MVALVGGSMPTLSPTVVLIFYWFETVTLTLFAFEYAVRLWSSPSRIKYATSFFGIVDFLSVIPVALGLIGVSIRSLRLLRILRLFKLARLVKAEKRLINAARRVRDEIYVCAIGSLVLLFIAAAGIYEFEHSAQPEVFSSIPASFWWATATLTTVGYGDAYPVTVGGKVFTMAVLLIGVGIVAVPTGLIARALMEDNSN